MMSGSGSSVCAVSTVPQTEQITPSVSPASVQVGSFPVQSRADARLPESPEAPPAQARNDRNEPRCHARSACRWAVRLLFFRQVSQRRNGFLRGQHVAAHGAVRSGGLAVLGTACRNGGILDRGVPGCGNGFGLNVPTDGRCVSFASPRTGGGSQDCPVAVGVQMCGLLAGTRFRLGFRFRIPGSVTPDIAVVTVSVSVAVADGESGACPGVRQVDKNTAPPANTATVSTSKQRRIGKNKRRLAGARWFIVTPFRADLAVCMAVVSGRCRAGNPAAMRFMTSL